MNILIIVFAVCLIAYLPLQFFTLVLEPRYHLTLVLLLGQAMPGIMIGGGILGGVFTGSYPAAVLILIWSLVTFFVACAKVGFLSYLQVKQPKSITRQRVQVGRKHEEITLETDDQVLIKGFLIRNDHSKGIVILSHGGSRCKNSFENLGLAQWLSYDFNVFSFDTRGHFESGGAWTGDGKTVLDLKAAVDFAERQGFEQVGVFGRSLGGWSALLFASAYGRIDGLVVVAAPLTQIRNTPLVSKVERLKSLPGRFLVRMVDGLRFKDYDDTVTQPPIKVLHDLETPTLLIYGMEDPVVGLNEADIRAAYETIPAKKHLHLFDEVVHLPSSYHLGPIYLLARNWFLETLAAS